MATSDLPAGSGTLDTVERHDWNAIGNPGVVN
jgi:hypothetical protein